MRESPPPKLIALLEGLGLATAAQVGRMSGRVRRLARDLPRFESVWVDALAQARILTPFQAAEINAGRGRSLRIGPYVLCESLRWPEYVGSCRARRLESGEVVRLAAADHGAGRGEAILAGLETLAAASAKLDSENLAPVTEVGIDGGRIWAASPWIEGRSAAQWVVHNGRFPPEVVLEIARAMLAGLCGLETAGLCHGDLSAWGLLLTDTGAVVLLQPGIRGILRPEEGYAHADLRPEAYDCLAPERITDGTPPSTASDVYACGCVWWHLLCGRPPLAGGNSLAKLRSARAARVFDVRRLAPDVPASLASAVSACLRREPGGRPESMARLAAMLGSPTRCGKTAVVGCLTRARRSAARWPLSAGASRRSARAPWWRVAFAACLAAAAGILWPVWRAWMQIPPGRQECSTERPSENGPGGNVGVAFAGGDSTGPNAARRGRSDTDPDRSVVQAHYEASRLPSDVPPTAVRDLVLSADGPLELESLRLRAGQCVRGPPGRRPLVMVPRDGLVVDTENVRFQEIDFVYDHPPETPDAAGAAAAIVDLRRAGVEFRGCTFRSARTMPTPPVAVRWTHPADPGQWALSLPSGRVQLSDCVLRGVEAGIDCRTAGALAIELVNTLQLGSGPLVRLDHCPKLDEPVLIAMSQVTLRGAGAVLEYRYGRIEDQPGEISVQTLRCALVPGPGGALLLLGGPQSPQRLLANTRWTGQGSVVSPETVIAAWREPNGKQRALDEGSVAMDGLVRSRVDFAGEASAGPGASQVIRWQAPLRSTDPPGIDPEALPARPFGGARLCPTDGLPRQTGDRGRFDKSHR